MWLAGDGSQVQSSASWKEKEQVREVCSPMHANDSQGGKARDAQIIRGKLEREDLSHMRPEILVPQVPSPYGGGGRWVKVHPAGRDGNLWKDASQNL